jgi:arylsulfatase A-like enzyme
VRYSRRRFLQTLSTATAGRAISAERRPNIILFLADDLGYGDISSFGCADIRTPNVDAIGQHGVRFSRFYCNAPECTPTRTALLTGRYQHRVGGLECAIGVGNVGRYDEAEWLAKRGELGLPATETTFAKILQQSGYATAIFGKWHLGYLEKFRPNHHGFDEYLSILGGNADYFTHKEEDGTLVLNQNGKPLERKGYTTDILAEAAIGWLRRRDRAKPFFLYLPFTSPHTPIQDPDEFDPKTGTAPWRDKNRKVYGKMVERMDQRIGDVLRELRAIGQEEDTIVVFHSDNGADPNGNNGALRGRKGTLWEGGIRVPAVIRWPGHLPEGKTVTQVTLTMDVAPTLLGAAGVKPPAGVRFDGMDVMPMVAGRREAVARTVFWRYKRLGNIRKAARAGDLKLVIDNGAEELHDLAKDEREEKNLLPGAEAEAAKLRRLLANWEREVRAPRLRDFGPG